MTKSHIRETYCGRCNHAEQVKIALPEITLMILLLHQSWTPGHHTGQPNISEKTLLPEAAPWANDQ